MKTALAFLVLLVGAGFALADAEILGVESATGGIWRPGRFSCARVRVRASPGTHEIRGRLEPGKVVVVTLDSAGGEEIVLLPLLPERDANSVEIDAGDGWAAHPLSLRRHDDEIQVSGVCGGMRFDTPGHAVPLPSDGGPAALRDVCDVVYRSWPAGLMSLPRYLVQGKGGHLTTGPVISSLLADRFASATVTPSHASSLLPVLAMAIFMLFSAIHLTRRLGWSPVRTVCVAVALCAVLLLGWWGVSVSTPRVSCRGFSLVRFDGTRIDFLVLASRGEETLSPRFSDGPDILVRPLPDRTGRIGPYTLRAGVGLDDLEVGAGRLAFVRVDRDLVRRRSDSGRDEERVVEDAFLSHGSEGVWIGNAGPRRPDEGDAEPLTSILDRFRASGGTRPRTLRGRLLVKVVRPGLREGHYGFLVNPPRLDAQAIGVESAEIVEAILVP
jgi:hypothetical protein